MNMKTSELTRNIDYGKWDRIVTLHDGREVSNHSEAWRHECEARTICQMATKQERRNYLHGYTKPDGKKFKGVLGFRGPVATAELEATVRKIWAAEFAEKPEPAEKPASAPPPVKKGLL